MSLSGDVFVLSLVAISTGGWLADRWIRVRHGYSLDNDEADQSRQRLASLAEENAALREQLSGSLERIGNLERIVIDSGFSTAQQIEALREPQPATVPGGERKAERVQ